jgi:hypothetical protein
MSVKRQTRKVGVAGSFFNQLMGNNISVPVVGEGATILSYSDREAFEVISVDEDSSSCVIRSMDCKFVGSCYGDEQYTYSSNEDGRTQTIEWNEKRQCWGQTYRKIEIIKALQKKLYKVHGFGWSNYLPIPFDELIDGERLGVNTRYKLVKGVTKEYKKFYPVSIIFGVMEQYRDPSF